ncbi:MAG: PIG-L family deacetylase [Acidobacteria bacterium]|nr:PIG-L family deacetylase [Acidobacteriota bacterium]
MRRLALIAAVLIIAGVTASAQGKVILGVFAHPDDENLVGPVLAKYARLGNKVYVIIATDGNNGTRVTKIRAGEELGRVRRLETACACEKLGIEKPIYFSQERLDTMIGVRAYLNAHANTKKLLKAKIEELKPDAIITFGPDGEYGHSEHLVIGSIVQEVLLREGWIERYPLYFPAFTKEQLGGDDSVGHIDPKYINLTVKFNDADSARYMEAAKCYVSQYTEVEIAELIADAKNDKEKILHFRRFSIDRKRGKTDLLK